MKRVREQGKRAMTHNSNLSLYISFSTLRAIMLNTGFLDDLGEYFEDSSL